jgi:hypothetical protein
MIGLQNFFQFSLHITLQENKLRQSVFGQPISSWPHNQARLTKLTAFRSPLSLPEHKTGVIALEDAIRTD